MNASVASMIYKFNMNNIQILQDMEYQVDVACNFGKENPISQEQIENFRKILKQKKIKVYETSCPRSVFAIGNMIKSYKQLKKIADEGQYDLVHTQSPIGGVICRLAFRKARKRGTKVIYTAHGFHFYKGAPIINWLIFYPIEKICSYFTDVLITINQEDYQLAKRKFHAKKVEYVPGVGINLEKFNQGNIDKSKKRKELEITDSELVFLSVGELSARKNHQVVIRALAEMIDKHDIENFKYFICGQGEKKDELEKTVYDLGLKNNVKFLGFRSDISEILEVTDVFVFPSYSEGLPVALMEAMACGKPCVVSRIRGNTELIDKNGGMLFEPNSVGECEEALKNIISSDYQKEGIYNRNKIKNFGKEVVDSAMKRIYEIYGGEIKL